MQVPQELWYAVAILVGLIVAGAIVRRILRRRRVGRLPPVDLSIDVTILGESGPPQAAPVVEVHGVAARVAAVVFAPSGRARPLPPRDQWPRVLEAVLPGLSRVLEVHRPMMRAWPPQLSESGFVHRFFAEVKVPKDLPGGSPWCMLAGPVRFGDQLVLVGFVFRTEEPTTLGTEAVEEPTEWRRRLSLRQR